MDTVTKILISEPVAIVFYTKTQRRQIMAYFNVVDYRSGIISVYGQDPPAPNLPALNRCRISSMEWTSWTKRFVILTFQDFYDLIQPAPLQNRGGILEPQNIGLILE